MPRPRPVHALPWAILVTFLAGCAATPTAPATAATPAAASPADAGTAHIAGLDCRQIDAEIAKANEARRAATEKQQDAWKAVVPFAVAARYASARSAVEDADKQLGALAAQSANQACADPVR